MTATKSKGGKRPNAGRKKETDPKVEVSFYFRQSVLDLFYGKNNFMIDGYKALETMIAEERKLKNKV